MRERFGTRNSVGTEGREEQKSSMDVELGNFFKVEQFLGFLDASGRSEPSKSQILKLLKSTACPFEEIRGQPTFKIGFSKASAAEILKI